MTDLAENTPRPLRGPLRKRKSHLWERAENDFYCEPEWCSERLFALEQFRGGVWDPACGTGRIVSSAIRAGLTADGSDIVDRGMALGLVISQRDFFSYESMLFDLENIVSNPPFKGAEKFVQHALRLAPQKVAMLLQTGWLQGDKRARWLATTPLYRVYMICPRPSMPPGKVIAAGGKPGSGTSDYAWFVWLQGFAGTPTLHWLHRDEVANG